MIIYKEIVLEWGGKDYTTKVNMRIINKIEQTVSLAGLAARLSTGDIPPLSHLAVVYGNLLRSGGAMVTDDDIFASMMGQDTESELSQTDVITASTIALSACFPSNAPKAKKKASR